MNYCVQFDPTPITWTKNINAQVKFATNVTLTHTKSHFMFDLIDAVYGLILAVYPERVKAE